MLAMVAHAPIRFPRGIVLDTGRSQLLAYAAYVLRDHLRIALVFPPAHALVDAVAIEHLPGVLRQERHDIELASGELDGSARHRYRAGAVVHGKVAVEAHLGAHFWRWSRARWASTRAPSTASENGFST